MIKELNGKRIYSIDYLRTSMEAVGYSLLSDRYSSIRKMHYVCNKGHKSAMTVCNWVKGRRCPICKAIKIGDIKRIDFNTVQKAFELERYNLLTTEPDYKSNKTKLKYVCPIGHTHSIDWSHWQQGRRCPICAGIKRSGAGHPNWNGGSSFEPYCSIWRDKEYKEDIKIRDGNKCLNPACQGKDKRIHIHHIDYNKKSCSPSNLITLCGSCNAKANIDREWHEAWYSAIIKNRYYNTEVACYGA